MKDYEVKALIKFDDVLEKVTRKKGDTFFCDKKRYEFLKEHNAVELINKIEKTKNEKENGVSKKADAKVDVKKPKKKKNE